MSTNEDAVSLAENQTPTVSPGNYNSSPVTVHMKDTIGAIALGVLTIILLIGWMRSEARCRSLLTQIKLDQ